MEEMVSIVIPTYNRANVIGRAIQSILRQTYDYYEIIVVDDGSTDHTKEVVEQFSDDRIRYIRLEENQGVAHARNVGIQRGRYPYIAFLDSDDEWMPDKLKLQLSKMMELSKEFGLVYCRMGVYERESGELFVCPPLECPRDVLEGDMFPRLLVYNVIGTPAILARRECLESVGGFKESLKCLEDWEMILRIAQEWKIGFVEDVLVEIHRSSGSVSSDYTWDLITKSYLVSHYRKELRAIGMLEDKEQEILKVASRYHLYEEIKELLTRDFEL